jgi:ribosomal protein S18 acetylase RimI-like enzyme
MKIRSFRLSDALLVMELWEKVLPQKTEALELLTEQLSRDSDLVLVAELDGELVGTIVGTVCDQVALVHRIAVLPSHRGQGIGKELLSSLELRCHSRGVKELYYSSDDFNELASPFYRAMGLHSRSLAVQQVS